MELRPSDQTNLIDQLGKTGRGTMSHSSISTQLSCLRKYGWSYVENLELVSRPKALSLGSAFHKAIELGDPQAGAETLLRDTRDQEEEDRMAIDMATVIGAASLYLTHYGVLFQKDIEDITGIKDQRELEYLVRLRNPATGHYSQTFDLHGVADGVIDHGEYLELIEDKFVGRIDALSVAKVKLDRQVSLTCYALWRVTGKPVRKIRYRFTKKPSIKVRQKETVEEFCGRLMNDYMERPDFYLHEELATRTPDDLLVIEAELWDWAMQRRNAAHRNFYARNTSSCLEYGGCAFIPLCIGDPDAMALYQQRKPRVTEEEE